MFSLVERRRRVAGADADAGARFRRTAGGWLAAAVAGALLLSGCSGSGEPDADAAETPSVSPSATPSESQSPSPSPSPSAVYKPASAEGPAENVPLPVMPEEAKVESKEGLIAFARHWYDLANYGYETGDVEPLKAISGPDCFACASFYRTVQSGFQDGWIVGAQIEVWDVGSTYGQTDSGRFQALTQFVQDPLEFYTGSGLARTADGNELPSVQMMEATYADGVWTAIDVVTIHESP